MTEFTDKNLATLARMRSVAHPALTRALAFELLKARKAQYEQAARNVQDLMQGLPISVEDEDV